MEAGLAWVRSAGLRGVRTVVESLGGDADQLAQQSGVPRGALDDDELLVQDVAIATLLETAARTLRCPDFGLRVALHQDLSMLGPLAVAMQNSRTVAEALECTSKFMFVHARGLGLELVPDPRNRRGVIGIRYGYPLGTQAPPQSMDMGLLFLHRALISLAGPSYGLRSVEVPHAPAAARQRYLELFGATVHYERPAAVLRVSSDLTGRALTGADQLVGRLAYAYLATQAPDVRRAVTGRVRALLAQALGTGSTAVSDVAALLALSPRTLQRHLADEGTSFARVLDEVRQQRARELLTRTDMPLAQISSLLGFADQATLSRYARRWWGHPARALRTDARP